MRCLHVVFLALALSACDDGIVHVSRYPDGRIRERWTEKGPPGKPTLREGEYRSFHPDGKAAESIPYRTGREDGRGRSWDARGRLMAEREWERGFLVRETRYDTLGARLSDRRFEVRTAKVGARGPAGDSLTAEETCSWSLRGSLAPAGREGGAGGGSVSEGGGSVRDGLCEMRYPGGALLASRRYREGRLHGPLRAWYEDGTPWIAGSFAEGSPAGAWKSWSRGGNLLWSGAYRRGDRDGTWEERYPDGGRKSVSRYRGGKAHGEYREWYPNGRPRLRGAFSGGRREGLEEAWYPDGGRLYAARYAAGRLEGGFLQWHPGGKLRLRCAFSKGRKQGLSRVWYPSGRLQEQAYFRAGRLDGPYRTWSPEGLPMAMKEFRDGALAFDSKARELLELLGADQVRVPAGMMGFYWGMGARECRANLGLYQASGIRADSAGMSAEILAFPDRLPTRARIRLAFNSQGELWGIRLDLRQGAAADFFPLCENLEVEIGAGLGVPDLIRPGGRGDYAVERKRDWGRFTATLAQGGVRKELPVLSAGAYGPGGEGWIRFSLENNLYREYVDPANVSITPPRWEGEALFAGR